MSQTKEIDPTDYMAVWEAMLEVKRRTGTPGTPALAQEPQYVQDMVARWHQIGTVAMREWAIQITHAAVEAFESLPLDEQEGFDWEFVPGFLKTVEWNR